MADDDTTRHDLEFLRAMREMEVRPKREKRPKRAAARDEAPPPPSHIEEEDGVFAAHMERLFSDGPPAPDQTDRTAGGPPAPDRPASAGTADAPPAPDSDGGAVAPPDPEREAAEDAVFARYMAALERGEAPPAAPARATSDDGPETTTRGAEAPADDEDDDGDAAADLPPKNPLLHGSAKGLQRRLRKGEIEPEAEVDLHRMTRGDALGRLDAFLEESVSLGRELVLVITGKGKHSVDLGVLRELVPVLLRRRWPHLVRQCMVAPRRLGGEGAFVVFLRRVAGQEPAADG